MTINGYLKVPNHLHGHRMLPKSDTWWCDRVYLQPLYSQPFYPQYKQCIRWAQFSKSMLNILLLKFLVNFCSPVRASLTIAVTPIHHLHTSVVFRFAAKKNYDTRAVTSQWQHKITVCLWFMFVCILVEQIAIFVQYNNVIIYWYCIYCGGIDYFLSLTFSNDDVCFSYSLADSEFPVSISR